MMTSPQFGPYQIVRRLGGGMAEVYLARDTLQGRPAVLKLIPNVSRLVLEAERRGAAIQRQLHAADPRVVEIYEYGDRDGYFFVAMQYVEGRTLVEMLRREVRLEPRRAARIALEICSQLGKLHSLPQEAVVHGDIKPSNLQIGEDDRVWLLDFGISKALRINRNSTHDGFGSPSYCSPERLGTSRLDPQADLWAVGVTLYEMLAGAPPYQAASTRKLEKLIQSRRPPRALPEDCPRGLKAIVVKALAGDLAKRYGSAAAFHDDLALFLEGKETRAETERRGWNLNPTIEAARPKPKPRRRIRVTRAAGMLGCLAIGLVVFLGTGYARRYQAASSQVRSRLDWDMYLALRAQYRFLGPLSPVNALQAELRAAYASAADLVIAGYRNSSDPAPQHFEWRKAQLDLEHAVDLGQADRATLGKLALCRGYGSFLQAAAWKGPNRAELEHFRQTARQYFEQAATQTPQMPDPHLALARVYVYSFRDPERAVAELRQAQRLGYALQPREIEQEADVYRFRGQQELQAGQRFRPRSAAARRYRQLAQRDFATSRRLYEGIRGFSQVDAHLLQLPVRYARRWR